MPYIEGHLYFIETIFCSYFCSFFLEIGSSKLKIKFFYFYPDSYNVKNIFENNFLKIVK